MGDINGLSLARKMRSISKSFILIFVTNYGEYAAEGYEVNAFRFLPKLQLKAKLSDYFSKALAACQSKNRTINVFVRVKVPPFFWISLFMQKRTDVPQFCI